MPTQKNAQHPGILESMSRLAGTVVGSAVGASKRIVDSATPAGKGPSDKPGEKTTQTPGKKVKKAARKTGAKTPKTKIKKVAKRKAAGTKKSTTYRKKSASSPSKKKKSAGPKKKATSRKTRKKTAKGEASGGSQTSKSPKVGANLNVSAGNNISTIASSRAGLKKSIMARSPEPSIQIVEHRGQRKNAAALTLSGSVS